jgi:hypothetical protein
VLEECALRTIVARSNPEACSARSNVSVTSPSFIVVQRIPGDDIAREVVQYRAEVKPASTDDLEWSEKRMSASPPRTVSVSEKGERFALVKITQ